MIDVPTHWSAEQADVVVLFLQGIIDRIWETYEDELVTICLLELQSHEDNTDENQSANPVITECDQWDDGPPF